MRKILLSIILISLSTFAANAQIKAFPGAEGFGQFAKGARAGVTPAIYHVTNLNDTGSGSFRDAISQPNRFIVFDVAGIININERLVFSGNLTVAGQTAPGDGITVYGNGVSFSGAKDVIVRYIRFRMGNKGDAGKDAAGIANGSDMIFDHISVAWGLDENFSISWDGKGTEPGNITIQKSIIGQGVMVHACGGLIQTSGGVSILKNLYIDNKTRNPKVKGLNQFVNNVIYNWGSEGGYILGGDSEGPSWGAIENNYFIKGPSTGGTDAFVRGNANFQVYHKGNFIDTSADGQLNGTLAPDSVFGPVTFVNTVDAFNSAPKSHPGLATTTSAADAYNWVIDSVGACIPARDEVDKYMLNEMISLGTKGALINGEADLGLVNSVGTVFHASKQTDTDNDGMPDVWEEANGLNKNEASDALLVASDGYLNIEHYINGITAGTPFIKYPTFPSGKAISTNSITFRWTNNVTDADSIVIEQSTDNVNFTEIARIGASLSEYKVNGLAEITYYYYRLKTIKGTLESLYSDVLKAKTLGTAAAPIACTIPVPADNALIASFTQTTLSWTNLTGNFGGVLHYDVFAGTSPDSMVLVADSITGVSFSLTVLPSTTYYWRVDAINYFGNQSGDLWSFTSGKKPEREKVAYWPMNETEGLTAANDVFGFATAQNFVPAWSAGKIGNAVTISSSPTNAALVQSHYDAISLGAESFSVELWFKSSGGAVDWYLIHKGSHVKNTTTGATGKWFGIQYNKTGSNDRLTWGIDDDVTKSYIDIKPGSTYFNNTWNHLVCIRDMEADKLYVYLNGVLKGSTTDNTGNIAETENIVLGNTNVAFINAFGGSIDEVSIIKGVLTAEEILENYQTGLKTGFRPVSLENNLKSYPNPFKDELTVQLPTQPEGRATVEFYSVTGQLSMVKQGNIVNNSIHINALNSLSNGVYICVIKTAKNESYAVRILK